MNTKESIAQERLAGTYNRNKLIRLRYEHGVRQAVIARLEGISRQRVFQILHQRDKLNWFQKLKLLFRG